VLLTACISINLVIAQTPPPKPNDANTPLYLMKSDYPVPYGPVKAETIVASIDKVYSYLESNTPMRLINKITKAEITDLSKTDHIGYYGTGSIPA